MRRSRIHGFWTRILLVLCLICQVIGSAVAQEPDPYPDQGEGLVEADPTDRQVEVWQDNGLEPALPNGEVTGEEPPLELPEQASNLAELIPDSLATNVVTATLNAWGDEEAAFITPAGATTSFLDGRVTIIADAGAFAEDVTISFKVIADVQAGATLTNPHELLRFELEAISELDGGPIKTFDKPVHIVVDLRSTMGLDAVGDWYLAYKDPDKPSLWHYPEVVAHDPSGLVSVSTDHFSTWAVGWEPGAWRYNWNAPAVSGFSGAATFRYPIAVPPGRAGLTPNIDISYSSRSVDGLVFTDDMDQGPLGLGWNFNTIEITRDKVHTEDDGANVFMHHPDRFSLVLNGESHELKQYQMAGNVADYYAVNAPGLRIQQIYDPAGDPGVINLDKLYWTVKTPDGTTYRLGYTIEAESGQQSAFLSTWANQLSGNRPDYGGLRWRVDTITDLYGNQIQFDYYVLPALQEEYTSNLGNITNVTTELRRIKEIRYNYVNRAPDANTRASGTYATKIVFGPTTGSRVSYVDLFHVDLATRYRRVEIGLWTYDAATNGNCGVGYRDSKTEAVNEIKQLNRDGSLYLPSTLLTYTMRTHLSDGNYSDPDEACYQFAYLEEVNNGYGGRVKFTYTTDNRIEEWWWWGITPYHPPEYGRTFFVTKAETWDGIHSQPAATEYSFQTPCYDQHNGGGSALGFLPGAWNCPIGDDINSYGHGALVGFQQTTITNKDYDGLVLSKTVTHFHQDRQKMGWPEWSELYDASDFKWQRQQTTYGRDSSTTFDFSYASSVSTISYAHGGQSSEHRVDYVYGRQNNIQYGNLTEMHDQGDVATSGDERSTYRGYYPNVTPWIVSSLAWDYTTDSTGTALAETTYYYDDNTCWENCQPTQGKVTKIQQVSDFTPLTFVTTQRFGYDTEGYGNLTKVWDALDHLTETTYDNTFRLMPVTVLNALNHTQTFQYYGFNGVAQEGNQAGLLKTATDANLVTTDYRYDPFGRLERVIRSGDSYNSPAAFYRYYDYGSNRLTAGPFMIASWRKTQDGAPTVFSTGGVFERQFFDGLGRLVQTQRPYTDWDGAGGGQDIIQDWNYNAAGQATWQSIPYLKPAYAGGTSGGLIINPYRSPDTSQPKTTHQYDAAGQLVRSVGLDGAVTSLMAGRWSAYSQDGNNHVQSAFYDAYGQLAAVDELVSTFADSFNDSGSLANWTTSGNVTVSSGAAHLSGANTYVERNLNDTASQDRGTSLSFRSADANLSADLYLWYPGGGSATRTWGLSVASGQLRLLEKANGVTTYTNLMAYKANTWYRLLLRGSKGTADFVLVVWEEGNPAERAEMRLAKDPSWQTVGWRFRSQIYSSGASLDLDTYDELNLNRTTYTYDGLGRLTQTTNWVGLTAYTTNVIEYDPLSRKTRMRDLDMNNPADPNNYWLYDYDNASNLISQTDAKGQKLCFAYDNANRLLAKRTDPTPADACPTSGAEVATYTYDAGTYGKGRRTGMTAYSSGVASNLASWTYDARGRVTNETRVVYNVAGSDRTYVFGYTYTEGDLLATMTYPGGSAGQSGETVTNHYWYQTGQPKGLVGTSWYVGTNTYQNGVNYNALGQSTSLRFGNNKVTTYSYDSAFRVDTVANDSGYMNLDYSYDKAGNVTQIADWAMLDMYGTPQRQDFTYDSLNRLLTAATTGGSSNGQYSHTYSYDALGNLTSKAGVSMGYGQASGIAPNAKPHAVTHLDGAQKHWYDYNGAMTRRLDGGLDWTLTWSVENRLVEARENSNTLTPVVMNMTYDADGGLVMRVKDGTTTIYLGQLYLDNVTTATATRHYWLGGRLIGRRYGSGAPQFYLTDHLGSATTLLNSSGGKSADMRYDPWGEERWVETALPHRFRFTGQRYDDALDLYDYQARYYDPSTGRFISADVLVPIPSDPQSFNRFAYVRNNPLGRTDPTGHRECESADSCGVTSSAAPAQPSLVNFVGYFSASEQAAVTSAAEAVGDALANAYNSDQRMLWKAGEISSYNGITGTEAFTMTYGGPMTFKRTSVDCDGCMGTTASTGAEIYANEGVTVNGYWAVHELGHAFAFKVAGVYNPGGSNNWVGDQLEAAIPGGQRVSGQDGFYGFAGTLLEQPRVWHQADPAQVGETYEEFADMFLGFTYGQWETRGNGSLSPLGSARASFMANNIPAWMNALAVGHP